MTPLKMTVKQFCKHFNACSDGAKWAIENCKTMADAWDTAKLDWAIWIMTREGVSDDKTMRLFACWCARNTPCVGGKTTWGMMPSDDSRNAIVVAERYAIGEASDKELEAAGAAAWAAARAAAWDAAWEAAGAAAGAAAWAAARAAARDAAWEAAGAAAWAAARAAARAAAGAAQLAHFRTLPNPFKRAKVKKVRK